MVKIKSTFSKGAGSEVMFAHQYLHSPLGISGFSWGRVSLCPRWNPGQLWSTSHEVTHCHVQTHQASSKLEPVSTGLEQLCHVQICAGPCPEAVQAGGGALAEKHTALSWNLFLSCHLLLYFALNRSEDPWKWALPSEADTLPQSHWV